MIKGLDFSKIIEPEKDKYIEGILKRGKLDEEYNKAREVYVDSDDEESD